MKRHPITCIYNKHFFVQLYKYMIDNQIQVGMDASNTVWHLLDVEELLVKEFGFRRTDTGITG